MESHLESRTTTSWEANADAWVQAVREALIPSRTLATNAAIVQAVRDEQPTRVLDLGCGEGWLARSLAADHIDVVGVDASDALIVAAREKGGAQFHTCSYADLVDQPTAAGSGFDVVVSNFALLHNDAAPVLRAVRSALSPTGALIIQTVHPWTAGRDRYEDHWKEETFERIGGAFTEAMPWYFRTLASWTRLLREAGYRIRELREPTAEDSTVPLSLILIASAEPSA